MSRATGRAHRGYRCCNLYEEIGRVAPATPSHLTEYPSGPAGAIWFTELAGGKIGRITTGIVAR